MTLYIAPEFIYITSMRIYRPVLIGYFLMLPAFAAAAEFSFAEAAEEITPASAEAKSHEIIPDVIMYALSMVGVNYKWGGQTPETGLDCSGFVSHVFSHAAGVALPHNAYAISRIGMKIHPLELQPGDLVFYKTLRKTFSHVGIYLGENRFVHASSTAGDIMISNMRDRYWARHFNGARRLQLSSPPAAASAE